MSIPLKVTIGCSKCGKQYQTTIYQSINTNFAKDIPEQIMSGSLFKTKCPHCKCEDRLEYEILYNDLNKNSMIWVVNPDYGNYEQKLSEIRTSPVQMCSLTRSVKNVNELREKVNCLYGDKDDRAIELCKQFLKIQLIVDRPDFNCVSAFYAFDNGKDVIFFYDDEGNELFSFLDEKLYKIMIEFLGTKCLHNEVFAVYDDVWAESVFSEFIDYTESSGKFENVVEGAESKKRPQILYCRICGEKLIENSLFCSYCGTKVWQEKASVEAIIQ